MTLRSSIHQIEEFNVIDLLSAFQELRRRMDHDSTQEVERRLELDTGTGHAPDDDEARGSSGRRDCCGDDASREEVECI